MTGKISLKDTLLTSRAALIVIVAAAVTMRIVAAAARGDYLGFDESMYILLGRNLLSGKGYVLNGLPNATFPYGISLLAGVGDALFGARWALSLPSAALGGLAVIPLYHLAARMTSRVTAIAAAVLYAGFPSLLFFSPFVSYGRRLYEGSEQIYILLTLTMAYFAYSAVVDGRLRQFVFAGLFCGAAFEIRQEAAALCALLAAWMLLTAAWRRSVLHLAKALAFPAAALLVALPFLIHVRTVTGAFGPGMRLAGSLPMRDAFMPVVEKNDWSSALNYLLALSRDGTQLEHPYYGVSDWHRDQLRSGTGGVGAMSSDLRPGYVLEAVRLFVEKAVPDKLVPLLLAGFVALFVGQRRWVNSAFIALMALPAAFLAMALFPLARFSFYLAPYAVLLIASGICLIFEVAGLALKRLAPYGPAAAVAVAAAFSAYGAWDSLSAQKGLRDNRKNYERVVEELQKRASQWLFVNTAPDALVMADSPQACVLARRQWLALPRDSESRVMEYARAKRAVVAVRTGESRNARPRLMESALVAIFSDYTRDGRVSLMVYDVAKFGIEAARLGSLNRFILVTVDTLRADHLGCYGYGRDTTPAIDALARESSVYTRAFSACSYTGPSVTSIHTSRYPGLNDSNFANGYPVPPVPVATIAKAFGRANFRTAAFVGNSILRRSAGLAEGFQLYDATFTSAELNRRNVERVASDLAPAAISWLEKNAGEPFFMWVHFQDPHGPYAPPEPYASRFPQSTSNPVILPVLSNITGYKGIPSYQRLGDRQDLEFYVSQYDGEIAFADDWIGKLLAKVRDLGIWDSTVIVVTSDHGEAFGENDFYCAHGHWVGPELTRVPLVVRVPGVASGSSDTPVSLVDIGPTLVDLAGIEVPPTFMGKSLIRSAGNPAREKGFFIETPYAIAACDGRFSYVWGRAVPNSSHPENNKATSPELFDFAGAPTGLHEVVPDVFWTHDLKESDPDTAARLRATCQGHVAESLGFCNRIPVASLDEDSKKALEALGYMNK